MPKPTQDEMFEWLKAITRYIKRVEQTKWYGDGTDTQDFKHLLPFYNQFVKDEDNKNYTRRALETRVQVLQNALKRKLDLFVRDKYEKELVEIDVKLEKL